MPRMLSTHLGIFAASLLLVCACQNVPKYKRSNGKFAEWNTYEGKNFTPSGGTVTAVDPVAGTVTVILGKHVLTVKVDAQSKIYHEGTEIPLVQLPVHQGVKILLSDDRTTVVSIWYGQHLGTALHRPGGGAKR